MSYLLETLEPIKIRIDQQSAYLGALIALSAFVFSLFLPWASIPSGWRSIDGSSSSGWKEYGFVSLLPMLPMLYRQLIKRGPIRPNILAVGIMISLLCLALFNVSGRSQWSSVSAPWQVSGSVLDAGFWLGLASLIGMDVCLISWMLHRLTQQP